MTFIGICFFYRPDDFKNSLALFGLLIGYF